jgi:excinuclease ABC subunit A
VKIDGRSIVDVSRMTIAQAGGFFKELAFSGEAAAIAQPLLREIQNRLGFLCEVGVDYLGLDRAGSTLSGGEFQRIRLATQIGSALAGICYVLDEPTIGLHPRDNRRLLAALRKLRDLGNTLLVVEHDREVVRSADQLLDFGPGAGRNGGQIVAQGTPAQVAKRRGSVTGPYLSGKKAIPVPTNRRMSSTSSLSRRERAGVREVLTLHIKVNEAGSSAPKQDEEISSFLIRQGFPDHAQHSLQVIQDRIVPKP